MVAEKSLLVMEDRRVWARDFQVVERVELEAHAATTLPVVRTRYSSMLASLLWPPWVRRPQSLVPVTYKRLVLSILVVINVIAS